MDTPAGPTGRYRGLSAAERRAERRAKLLDAALDTMGAGAGFRGTTITALCRAAKLSTRQFYEEFATLEDVLAALYRRIHDRSGGAVAGALAATADAPLPERIRATLRAHAAATAGDPRLAQIAYVQVVGVSPALEALRAERRAQWIALLRAQAAEAVARGELAYGDYTLVLHAFVGAVNGLLHDWAAGQVPADFEAVVDTLVRQLLAGLGGTVAPAGG
ncbi:TetR/AcrR family transcriptional regulator [Kitasatospora phosalacinea]|uniref:TetR/AcrR family transcriptional regulator n=1 Tax=Kitasatospora phosalacinea TaxID=2065 RepID=A0ABW6GUM4_9ACTN